MSKFSSPPKSLKESDASDEKLSLRKKCKRVLSKDFCGARKKYDKSEQEGVGQKTVPAMVNGIHMPKKNYKTTSARKIGFKQKDKAVQNVHSVKNDDCSKVETSFPSDETINEVSVEECVRNMNDKSASTSPRTKSAASDVESVQIKPVCAISDSSETSFSSQDVMMVADISKIQLLDSEPTVNRWLPTSSFSYTNSGECDISDSDILFEMHFGEKCELNSRTFQHAWFIGIDKFGEFVESINNHSPLCTNVYSSSNNRLSNTETISQSKVNPEIKSFNSDVSHICSTQQKNSPLNVISALPSIGSSALLSGETAVVSCASNEIAEVSLEIEQQNNVVNSVDSLLKTPVTVQESISVKSNDDDVLIVDLEEGSSEACDDYSEVTAMKSNQPLLYNCLTCDMNPVVVLQHSPKAIQAIREQFPQPEKDLHDENLLVNFHDDQAKSSESFAQSSVNINIADAQEENVQDEVEIVKVLCLDCTEVETEHDVGKDVLTGDSSLNGIEHSGDFQLPDNKISKSSNLEASSEIKMYNAAIADASVKLIPVSVILEDILSHCEQYNTSNVTVPEPTNDIELSIVHVEQNSQNAFSSSELDYSNNESPGHKSAIDSSVKNADFYLKEENGKNLNKSCNLSYSELDSPIHLQDANNNCLIDDCESAAKNNVLVDTSIGKVEACDMQNCQTNLGKNITGRVVPIAIHSDSSRDSSIDSAVQSAESIRSAETNNAESHESIMALKVDEIKYSNEVPTSFINESLSSVNDDDNDSGFVMNFLKQSDNSNGISTQEEVAKENLQLSAEVPFATDEYLSVGKIPEFKCQEASENVISAPAKENFASSNINSSDEMKETLVFDNNGDNDLEEGEILDTVEVTMSPKISHHQRYKPKMNKKRKSGMCHHKLEKKRRKLIEELQKCMQKDEGLPVTGNVDVPVIISVDKHLKKKKVIESKSKTALKRKLCRSGLTSQETSKMKKTKDQCNDVEIVPLFETPIEEETVKYFSVENFKHISITVPATGSSRKIMLADTCVNDNESIAVQQPCVTSVEPKSCRAVQKINSADEKMTEAGELSCDSVIEGHIVMDSTVSSDKDTQRKCSKQVTLSATSGSHGEILVDDLFKANIQDKTSQKHASFASKSSRKNSDKLKAKVHSVMNKKHTQSDLSHMQEKYSNEHLQMEQVILPDARNVAYRVETEASRSNYTNFTTTENDKLGLSSFGNMSEPSNALPQNKISSFEWDVNIRNSSNKDEKNIFEDRASSAEITSSKKAARTSSKKIPAHVQQHTSSSDSSKSLKITSKEKGQKERLHEEIKKSSIDPNVDNKSDFDNVCSAENKTGKVKKILFNKRVPTKHANADLNDDLYDELDFEPDENESHSTGNAFNSVDAVDKKIHSDDFVETIVHDQNNIDCPEPTTHQSALYDVGDIEAEDFLTSENLNVNNLIDATVDSLQNHVCDEISQLLENQATSSIDPVDSQNDPVVYFSDDLPFVNQINNYPDFEETETEEEMDRSFKRSRTKSEPVVSATAATPCTKEWTTDVQQTCESQPVGQSAAVPHSSDSSTSEQKNAASSIQPVVNQMNLSDWSELIFPPGYCYEFIKHKQCKKKSCTYRHEEAPENARIKSIKEDCNDGMFRKACQKSEELLKRKIVNIKKVVLKILLEAAEKSNNPDVFRLIYEVMETCNAFSRDTCSQFILSSKAKARETLPSTTKIFDICVKRGIRISSQALQTLNDLFCLDRSSWLPLVRLMHYKLAVCNDHDIDLNVLDQILLCAPVLCKFQPENANLVETLCSVLILLPPPQFAKLSVKHIERFIKHLENFAYSPGDCKELRRKCDYHFGNTKVTDLRTRCMNLNKTVEKQNLSIACHIANGNWHDVTDLFNHALQKHEFHVIKELHYELSACLPTACERLRCFISVLNDGNNNLDMLRMQQALLLASIGTALILEAIATRQLAVAMDIFEMLWMWNIDFVLWIQGAKSAGFFQNKDDSMHDLVPLPSDNIALHIVDLCIECKKPMRAFDFLQDNFWLPMDNNEVKPSAENFELRAKLLLKLCLELLKTKSLSQGTEVLHILLETLEKDVKFKRIPQYLAEGINRCYNKFLAARLNEKNLDAADALYNFKRQSKHQSLDVHKSIIRAFIDVAVEWGNTEKCEEFFTYSGLMGIYSCNYNASSYPPSLKLFTHLSPNEIQCIIHHYLDQMFFEMSGKVAGIKSEGQFSLKIQLEEPPSSSCESAEALHLAAIDNIPTDISYSYARTVEVLLKLGLQAERPNGPASHIVSVTASSLYKKFLLWESMNKQKSTTPADKSDKLSPSQCTRFQWQLSKYDSPFNNGSSGNTGNTPLESINQSEKSLLKKISPYKQYKDCNPSVSPFKSPSHFTQNMTVSSIGPTLSRSIVEPQYSEKQSSHLPHDVSLVTKDVSKLVKASHCAEPVHEIAESPVQTEKVKDAVCKNPLQNTSSQKTSLHTKRLKRKFDQSKMKDGLFHFDKNENFSISISSSDDSCRIVKTQSFSATNLDISKESCTDLSPLICDGPSTARNNSLCTNSMEKVVQTEKGVHKPITLNDNMQRLRRAEQQKSKALPTVVATSSKGLSAIMSPPKETTAFIASPPKVSLNHKSTAPIIFEPNPTTTTSVFPSTGPASSSVSGVSSENSSDPQVTKSAFHHPIAGTPSSSSSSLFKPITPAVITPKRTVKRNMSWFTRRCRTPQKLLFSRSINSPFREVSVLRKKPNLKDLEEDERSSLLDQKSVKGKMFHYILRQILLVRKDLSSSDANDKAVHLTRQFIEENNLKSASSPSRETLKKLTEFTRLNL